MLRFVLMPKKQVKRVLFCVLACLIFQCSLRASTITLQAAVYTVSIGAECALPGCTDPPIQQNLVGVDPINITENFNGYVGTNINVTVQANGIRRIGNRIAPPIAYVSVTDVPAAGGSIGGSVSNVDVNITYFVSVVPNNPAAPPLTQVPIDIVGTGLANCSSSGVDALADGQAITQVGGTSFSAFCPSGSFAINNVLPFFVGSPTVVSLTVEANPLCVYDPLFPCSASARAAADPTFQIDPSFAYANDFTLIYSPNLVQSASVPEAPSFFLLSAGLLALGYVIRTRRTPSARHVQREHAQ